MTQEEQIKLISDTVAKYQWYIRSDISNIFGKIQNEIINEFGFNCGVRNILSCIEEKISRDVFTAFTPMKIKKTVEQNEKEVNECNDKNFLNWANNVHEWVLTPTEKRLFQVLKEKYPSWNNNNNNKGV